MAQPVVYSRTNAPIQRIRPLAGFDLDEFPEDLNALGLAEAGHGFLLGL